MILRSLSLCLTAAVLVAGCQKHPEDARVQEWGHDYYSLKPETIKREIVDIEGLESLWDANFDKSAPSWDGSERIEHYCIVPFRETQYAVSLPQYPTAQKETLRFFDIYIRNPESYSMDTDIMITMMFDDQLDIRSIALNASRFDVPYTKQLFVVGNSPDAKFVIAKETSKEARRLLKNDATDYWAYAPDFIERLILALCNHTKKK